MRAPRTLSALTLCSALVLAGSPPARSAPDSRATDGLVFHTGFDDGGVVRIAGGTAWRVAIDEAYLEDGRYGRAYRFEPPGANFLGPDQATPKTPSAGFRAGPGTVLSAAARRGVGGDPALVARGAAGLLWETVPAELSGIGNYTRTFKTFLGSVHLRSAAPGVRVRLEILDAAEDDDWRKPILDANAAALKKDPKAKVSEPLETKTKPVETELTGEWRRVAAEITVDLRRPVQKLFLRLTLISPEAVVEASRLQIEQTQAYPHFRDYAGPWIPGGTKRAGNAFSIPLSAFPFNGVEGTMAAWVKLPTPETGGTRGGGFLTAGGGWWRPIWSLSTYRCYFGDSGKTGYRKSGIYFRPSAPAGDGRWHHMAITWRGDVCALVWDGKELARDEYAPAGPLENSTLLVGATTLEGSHSSAILDEVSVWNRALSPEELAALAAAEKPLAAGLPSILLERPARLVFHRGEARARMPVTPVLLGGKAPPPALAVEIPALAVKTSVPLAAGRPASVEIMPWKAAPGTYPATVSAPDGTVVSSLPVEIVASLPAPDFIMEPWNSGPEAKANGFTAELTGTEGIESALRRSMYALLRYDARAWHPLDPKNTEAALATAAAALRRAKDWPHIVGSLLNTEVGMGKPPDEPWFTAWMKKETGLSTVPAGIRLNPMLVSPKSADPLIPDDDPALRFVRWFLRRGKGWPELNRKVADMLRAGGLADTLFYTDQPHTTADLEGLDMVEYWDYPHVPAGLVAEFSRVYNIARLAGKKAELMPGTIYWDPWPYTVEGKTVCLSPDMLRQYFWIAAANPLDQFGVYSQGMASDAKEFMLPGTREAFRETVAAIRPLGVLTGGLKAPPAPAAYLTSDGQIWTGPGDNEWILYWFNRMATRSLAEAGLRFDWIGDEHVEAGWLRNYRAVVVPGTWKLPAKTHAALAAYARAGGEVVVDKCFGGEIPGATVLPIANRAREHAGAGKASVDALQSWARDFRARRPDGIRLREGDRGWLFEKADGPARFVFVVNDLFEPGALANEQKLSNNMGTRTGPLHDKGREQTVRLTVEGSAGKALYDARAGRRIRPGADGAVELALGPGDAAAVAVLPEEIAGLAVSAPERMKPGTEAVVSIEIRGASGRPVAHREIVEIAATDAAGAPLDLDRWRRVTGGKIGIPLRLPLTAPKGPIRVEIREGLAGLKQTKTILVAD